jgi:hypothetical protein
MLVVYSAWWWLAARDIETQADRWIAGQIAAGATITPARVSVGGFPFAFSIKTTGASLAWPDGLGFASQGLDLRAHPWSIRTVKVGITGGYTISVPPGTTRPALAVAGETLRGRVRFGDGAVPLALSLRSDTVSVTQTAHPALSSTGESATGESGNGESGGRELTIASLEANGSRPDTPPTRDTDIALDVSLKMTDLSAAAIETNPLGGAIKETRLHAQLLGVPPVTADAAGLMAWRDAGGTLNVPELAVQWGPLGISGNGTAALDKNMQPEGAFTASVTGFAEALDALSAAGWIKMSVASLAKLGLGIASRPGPDGKAVVKTPVTIQDRHISLGAFRLGQVPPLKLD